PAAGGALRGRRGELGQPSTVALADCDALLMRKDPPYGLDYHLATLLLERARGQSFLMNDPRGLREANEKLYALEFAAFLPPTVVTRQPARLRAFLAELGGELIVKPVEGHGGRGGVPLPAGRRQRPSVPPTPTSD